MGRANSYYCEYHRTGPLDSKIINYFGIVLLNGRGCKSRITSSPRVRTCSNFKLEAKSQAGQLVAHVTLLVAVLIVYELQPADPDLVETKVTLYHETRIGVALQQARRLCSGFYVHFASTYVQPLDFALL